MRASDLFYEFYQIANIKKIYLDGLKNKYSPGIDRVNNRVFEKKLNENINIIHRKVLNGTYSFTNYKQKLISKGKEQNPRVVSIPTIRDRITLLIIKDIIAQTFGDKVSYSIIHKIIVDINESIHKYSYDYYFKLDVSKFYDSINQDLLMKRLKNKIRKKELLQLIERAIKTPTVEENYSKGIEKRNDIGVPQGLSISNILASLYLSNFDTKHKSKKNYRYFRFVDDILVLCNEKDFKRIKAKIEQELENKYFLHVNRDKEDNGTINRKISYLGYIISEDSILVRASSIRKLELSLERLFKEFAVYQKFSLELFVWKLNIKITGLIKNENKLGWVFFFSEVTDLEVFFHLDWLVKTYIKRFNLEEKLKTVKIKKYIRTYNEINKNLHGTTYIPNLDKYTVIEKRDFIENVLGMDVSHYDDNAINEIFEKKTFKFIKELEKDLQHFS